MQVGPRNHVLMGIEIPPREVAIFGGCPAHGKAVGMYAAVYTAKGIIPSSVMAQHAVKGVTQSLITARHALWPFVKILLPIFYKL